MVSSLSLYGEQPELILWIKPIFASNPTELGKVMERLELRWDCDKSEINIKEINKSV